MSKSKSKQEEALELLDDLDSFTPPPGSNTTTGPTGAGTGAEGEAEVLAFLDEITQKSSEPTRTSSHLAPGDRPSSRSSTPTGSLRKPTERVRLGGGTVSKVASNNDLKSKSSNSSSAAATPPLAALPSADGGAGGGGWGSWWNSASTALAQARSVVDEQVKQLPNVAKNIPGGEAQLGQARKWGEGVLEYAKNAQLDKLGQDFKRVGLSTLTDILNVVAPPIAEHEIIQVWLSHDMSGFDGIEGVVFRALSRIMEQVEGGDLRVSAVPVPPSSARDPTIAPPRDLNPVEGFEAAVKLANAELVELIRIKEEGNEKDKETDGDERSNTTTVPIARTNVYLRIQPYTSTYSVPTFSSSAPSETRPQSHLQFLLYLSDPSHSITHSTISQSVPSTWLVDAKDTSGKTLWDKYEWVEDLVAEALRVGVEVVGQEYIGERMGWVGGDKTSEGEKTEAKEKDTGKVKEDE